MMLFLTSFFPNVMSEDYELGFFPDRMNILLLALSLLDVDKALGAVIVKPSAAGWSSSIIGFNLAEDC